MKYQEYIRQHQVAAGYKENNNQCEPILMLSVENAEAACQLAERNLAQDLLSLSDTARMERLKKIINDGTKRKNF